MDHIIQSIISLYEKMNIINFSKKIADGKPTISTPAPFKLLLPTKIKASVKALAFLIRFYR